MNKNDFLIILDNGHGKNTSGKCSPLYDDDMKALDPEHARFFEWWYARKVAKTLSDLLAGEGYNVYNVCPEDYDVSITTRYRRANTEAKRWKASCLVCIHSNAAGNGGWYKARGFCDYVANLCSSRSKVLAKCITDEFAKFDKNVRTNGGKGYYQHDWGMVKYTNMPATLIENFFHDNKEDVRWALTEEGHKQIVNAIADGVKKYITSL